MSGFSLAGVVAAARERARRLPRHEPRAPRRSDRLREAIRGKESLDVIAEFKKRSPSAGAIAELDLSEQVERYQAAGAAAVSVLAEPTHFGGSYADLERAVRAVSVPVLMKDFVVDASQVRHAASLGASAVLLIVRCLSASELDELVAACEHYGLTALVECHTEGELELAMRYEDALLGVNNRDLDTLAVDRSVAPRLLARAPRERVVVAESGYESAEDVAPVRGLADAVLVGSALMRHPSPAELLEAIRS